MLNEPAEHECFEELCSLAAGGFASASELEQLEEHLTVCPECSQFLKEMCELNVLLTQRSDAIFAAKNRAAKS